MAPRSGGLAMAAISLVRDIGSRDDTIDHPGVLSGLDDCHIHIVKAVSLGFASLSVASVMLTFYWFLRMRRSFRHDLIMLLISSDMLKALWFMIFPIVDFLHGPIRSSSTFCQASGFFLSVGIEASDIAVFLIALHTALYIFKPRHSGGQNGLYPYRRTAYAIFVIFPLIMASLAFINAPGYTNNGEYCYLPVQPSWTKLALSWVPRYIILLTIIILYGCIYLYVTLLMRRFGRVNTMRRPSGSPAGDEGENQRYLAHTASVPPTPPIAYHGLIPSASTSRRGSATSTADRDRQQSVSTVSTLKTDAELHPKPSPQRPEGKQMVHWKWPGFGCDANHGSERREWGPTEHEHNDLQPSLPSPTYEPVSHSSPPHRGHVRGSTSEQPSSSEPTPGRRSGSNFWHRSLTHNSAFPSRAPSLPNLFAVLRRGPSTTSSGSTTSSSVFLSPSALDASGMAKTRDKIRRQLRLLFVYPLVYILIWFVPFISHLLRWDDPEHSGPFAVVLLSLISLSVQGTVNSWLFSTREKPWRHMRSSGSGPSLWKHVVGCCGLRKRGAARMGRTREEMLVDGRIARTRRDEEIAERRSRMEEPRHPRHWWDRMEGDGVDESDEDDVS